MTPMPRHAPTNLLGYKLSSERWGQPKADRTMSPVLKDLRSLVPYERRLDRDLGWALNESGLHFQGQSSVHKALRAIVRRLNELDIPNAIVGGMALFAHGFRRFTDDVDLLVTRESPKVIHEKLEGRGYLPPFAGSKQLRDTENGVKIEFFVTGGYPGDGKEKPVAFPDLSRVTVDLDGVSILALPTLIELKLASGMSNERRMKDITDVDELIRILKLPRDLAAELNPYVRPKYLERWGVINRSARRFVSTWRNQALSLDAISIDQVVDALKAAAARLEQMKADGITLDPDGGTADDYALLVTNDPEVAERYGFTDEEDLWETDPRAVVDLPAS